MRGRELQDLRTIKPAGANSLVVLTRTVSIEYLSFDFRTSPYPSVPAQVDTPLQV